MAGFSLSIGDAPAWYKFVSDYPTAHKQFNTNYDALLKLKSYVVGKHTELIPQYNKMVADGYQNKLKLDQLSSVRNAAFDWLDSVGGFFKRAVGLNGLGVVPVVVVGVGVVAAGATLAAVGYWVTDAYKFAQKLNALQAMEAKGVPPDEAARIIQETLGDSPFKLFGLPVNWLLIGGALAIGFYLLRKK